MPSKFIKEQKAVFVGRMFSVTQVKVRKQAEVTVIPVTVFSCNRFNAGDLEEVPSRFKKDLHS